MAKWKSTSCLLCVGWLLTAATFAQSPVTLTIDTQSHGYWIPEDFAGIGFETSAELPGRGEIPRRLYSPHNTPLITELPDRSKVSGRLFSPTNSQLITLFTNTGIRNLRLGGGTVDKRRVPIPGRADIDSVFGFARATGIKVIYSFRLLNGDAEKNASLAKYIWTHYRPYLYCFSIGNEPNAYRHHSHSPAKAHRHHSHSLAGSITNYANYLTAWRTFAAAITKAVPGAKFTGPEAAGSAWVAQFAKDEAGSGRVALVTQHEYACGKPFVNNGLDEIPTSKAIDNILSRNLVTHVYPKFYKKTLALVKPTGLACRMTEANDYLRGVTNASDAFASALWALDYLHWWAARGCAGVNFHNNQHRTWLKTDTFYLDGATREYRINPKAYGIRTFDLGSHGWVEPVAMINTNELNLTAYAVGDGTNLCVTIINKEHGIGAWDAMVTIDPDGLSVKSAKAMFLTATNGDAGAMNGITLGGALITNHTPWRGQWTVLHSFTKHQCKVTVPATSAAVVWLSAE